MEEKKARAQYLPAGECALFCAQAALILKAGVPLRDGMEALGDGDGDARAQRTFQTISETVTQTGSLYEAVRQAGVFPPYLVHMVQIGEKAGKLDDVMASMSLYYEREEKTRKAIRSAVLYPAVLVLMMAAVITILLVRVMPVFEQVFAGLGTGLSSSATVIMGFGVTAARCALALIALVCVVLLVLFVLSRTKNGGAALETFYAKLPLTRGLARRVSAARFASLLSMMLSSGYRLEEALALAPGILTSPAARAQVETCARLLGEGVSFPEALVRMGLFSGVYNRMIRVGFASGQLDVVMKKIADAYEEEVDDAVGRLVSILEPTIVAVLCVVIGVILLSVMLPLVSIMTSIG